MASPILLLGGLFITPVIGAYEGREVATFDDPEPYFYADIPKDKKALLK